MDFSATMESNSLIELVRLGDDGAFSHLVSLYTPMMNKVISGFVNSFLRYDEAFSEACVALHRAAMSYDLSRSGEVTFGLYARICVYRRVCDLAEKSAKYNALVDLDVELVRCESNIEQNLVGRERMSMFVERARGVLSEYEYSVFTLYIEGYSTAEMAEKLGRDQKSVENAKSRMLKHLREENDIFSDI